MQDLISIIVPVYNVADYLERCVLSITSQTYTHLEIIIVDDGSQDKSPVICDRLASQDKRIMVIHKTNGGLSSARNTGIDHAKGKYLAFVDSDDWLHPKYIESFHAEAQRNNCKMVIGEFDRCSTLKEFHDHSYSFETIPQEQAIPRMLGGEWISAGAKLFHCSLFEDIRFPEGRNNEDYAILIYLFEQCGTVSYTKNIVYYYFMREGSITHTSLNPHSFDEYINGMEIYDHCRRMYPQWSGLALFNLTASIIKLSSQCLQERKYMEKYTEMKEYTYKHRKEILQNNDLKFKYKPFLISMLLGISIHRLWLSSYNQFIKH